jgi:hypothetical protein
MAKHVIDRPQKAKGVVHKMIADTAKGCAREAWDGLAKQNAFYRRFPNADAFVLACWPQYLPVARNILVGMLGSPKYPDTMKAEIHEVLLKDGAVNPKRMAEPAKPSIFLGQKT